MDFVNPPYAFVLVDGILAPRMFGSFFRRYAASIELAGNEAVLEFGCGSGGISERLAPRLKEGAVTCFDISPPMIQIAARRMRKYDNVRCLVGSIEELALAESSFDVIVAHNALHDVSEEERSPTATALVRTLAPGGMLYLREPTKPSHGLPATTYRTLIGEAGLSEVRSQEYKVFPIGPVFDAVFTKPRHATQ